jgi:hypothetical protein
LPNCAPATIAPPPNPLESSTACTATKRSWNAGLLVGETSSMLATLSATASSHALYTPMPDVATLNVENTCDT